MVVNTTLQRVFKVGATEIVCAMPEAPFATALRAVSKLYPQFRQSVMYEDDYLIEGNKMVYVLPKVPPKSNG